MPPLIGVLVYLVATSRSYDYQYTKLNKCIILAEQNKHFALPVLTAGNKNIQNKIHEDILFNCLDMGCIDK